MADEKNLELMKKLRILAERGEGGERENAQALLEKLMEKYHVAEADLTEQRKTLHFFTYHGKWEKQLVLQVAYKITDEWRKAYYLKRGKNSRSSIGLICTEAEALQIQIASEFYCRLWAEELELFFQAFIEKHELFGTPEPGEESEKLDEATLRRLKLMMMGMQDKEMPHLLEEGMDVDEE